jgi:hypothetical protein
VQKGVSASHPKADMCGALDHVRFGSKADMYNAKADVRFTPESGHVGKLTIFTR